MKLPPDLIDCKRVHECVVCGLLTEEDNHEILHIRQLVLTDKMFPANVYVLYTAHLGVWPS